MKKTWTKPELKVLDVRMTANEWFESGTDEYWDGVADNAPTIIGNIISGMTGGSFKKVKNK